MIFDNVLNAITSRNNSWLIRYGKLGRRRWKNMHTICTGVRCYLSQLFNLISYVSATTEALTLVQFWTYCLKPNLYIPSYEIVYACCDISLYRLASMRVAFSLCARPKAKMYLSVFIISALYCLRCSGVSVIRPTFWATFLLWTIGCIRGTVIYFVVAVYSCIGQQCFIHTATVQPELVRVHGQDTHT